MIAALLTAAYFFAAGRAYEVVKDNVGRKPWKRTRALVVGLLWPGLAVYELWENWQITRAYVESVHRADADEALAFSVRMEAMKREKRERGEEPSQ